MGGDHFENIPRVRVQDRHELVVAGEMRENPHFQLRVVGREKSAAWTRRKSYATVSITITGEFATRQVTCGRTKQIPNTHVHCGLEIDCGRIIRCAVDMDEETRTSNRTIKLINC